MWKTIYLLNITKKERKTAKNACERYQNFFEEGKEKKCQYGRK